MADGLQAGDTVSLKSGGPLMTVQGLKTLTDGRGQVAICTWFAKEDDTQVRVADISLVALVKGYVERLTIEVDSKTKT